MGEGPRKKMSLSSKGALLALFLVLVGSGKLFLEIILMANPSIKLFQGKLLLKVEKD